ncbi:hypothetical protein PH210_06215 [Paenibacillus sp. BSR1-1]|uniref:hypothetical protein n=1 Tax=Paenibacillus sp. BSR1-1 TaxID=3020845 RepID=UPI0025B010BE|nr:hypothetical protein [Paenibacillus sp. BSR1-1]MDN3015800.1 hypothetical protein [Paenibacillus sp. BSR1-1]
MVSIKIDQEMVQRCLNFANTIILTNNQFRRIDDTIEQRIERTFVGKLAELAFLELLHQNNIEYPEGDMFTIYQGENNVDHFDFITNNGFTVDVKSASKPFHSRIMIPIDQFNRIPKHFYVGVKLNGTVSNDKILTNTITRAEIYGYCTYQALQQTPTENYGALDCKAINLNNLHPIKYLLQLFQADGSEH